MDDGDHQRRSPDEADEAEEDQPPEARDRVPLHRRAGRPRPLQTRARWVPGRRTGGAAVPPEWLASSTGPWYPWPSPEPGGPCRSGSSRRARCGRMSRPAGRDPAALPKLERALWPPAPLPARCAHCRSSRPRPRAGSGRAWGNPAPRRLPPDRRAAAAPTRLSSSTNSPQSIAEMKRRLATLLAMEIWSVAAIRLAASRSCTALTPCSESRCSSQVCTKARAGPWTCRRA